MKRFALLGDPVAHSKSPAMHTAAYRALDLPHAYEAIQAKPGDLTALVQSLRNGEYAGFNVTVPHKQRILTLVDEIDPSAGAVGAANTLVCAPPEKRVTTGVAQVATIRAYNTDVAALTAELRRLAPERSAAEWKGSRAVVLGSGGAARAAVAALSVDLGVGEVVVRSRRAGVFEPSAALPFQHELLGSGSPAWDDARTLTIVQATSAGMDGAEAGDAIVDAVSWRDLPARAVALDVIYAPAETPFLRAAVAHGIRSANGIGMLAMQGALAFELWLGVPAPYNAMLTAIVPGGSRR